LQAEEVRAYVLSMRAIELWRYPVKSLQGERVGACAVTRDGFEGDRQFVIYDLATGFGLTGRRVPELLFASARLRDDGSAEITLPDGTVAVDDEALSAWLGRSVALRTAVTKAPRRYENVVDFEQEPRSEWEAFDGASAGAFHDNVGARVSFVSTGTVGPWDPRRFRANVLLDGEGEDELVGSKAVLGGVMFDLGMRIERCVMTTRAQAGGIERDLGVLRTIARERDACLAIGALVAAPGSVRVGDVLAAA